MLDDEELDEEVDAVLPVEPDGIPGFEGEPCEVEEGMPGIEGELDPVEVWLGMPGIEGEEERDEEGDALGMEGDDELGEDDEDGVLGIDGLELLELEDEDCVWQPASNRQAITAAAIGLIVRELVLFLVALSLQ